MSSELWRDSSTVCRIRTSATSGKGRQTVVVLGEVLCLASFLTVFVAPTKAAIGAGALGLRTQASQLAPVEQIQSTNGSKKYRCYANGWNGPGYYKVGDAWKTGVGWGGGCGWGGGGGGSAVTGNGISGGPGAFGVQGAGNQSQNYSNVGNNGGLQNYAPPPQLGAGNNAGNSNAGGLLRPEIRHFH